MNAPDKQPTVKPCRICRGPCMFDAMKWHEISAALKDNPKAIAHIDGWIRG